MTDQQQHEHDWRVLDLCRDVCACGQVKRVCSPRHDHTAIAGSGQARSRGDEAMTDQQQPATAHDHEWQYSDGTYYRRCRCGAEEYTLTNEAEARADADTALERLTAELRQAYTLLISAEPTLIRDARTGPSEVSLHYKAVLRDQATTWLDQYRDDFEGGVRHLLATDDTRPADGSYIDRMNAVGLPPLARPTRPADEGGVEG
jgi:hypothetical protein